MDLDQPPGQMHEGPVPLTGTLAARAPGWRATGRDADRAVAMLYAAHYRPLVRLAALLAGDVAAAEEVVQESFVAMHGGWHRLRDSDRALSYLRQSVVSRCRALPPRHAAAGRQAPDSVLGLADPPPGSRALPERCAVVAALRALSLPEREALVLGHYAGLSERQIAGAMGISRGAVRCHTARARLALRAVLEHGT
jgi:RNA polymerase sigma factor (sigma-70 family)